MGMMAARSWPLSWFVVGVDLGQVADPTAICIIERITEPVEDWTSLLPVEVKSRFEVRHLERLKLGVSYVDQVAYVGELLRRTPLSRPASNGNKQTSLVIDHSGVGRPVFDLFASAGLRPIGVSIVAGEQTKHVDGGYRIGKLPLISRLQSLLHEGILKIAADLPEAATLTRELQDFRASFTASGNATFSAREGQHDDLVLATAIAAWHAHMGGNSFRRRTIKL
jgi:hypothetical protein